MEDVSRVLLERWQQGDEQAAADIFDRYVNRLIALARSKLGDRLRRRVDAEDVVQSVYRSFFRRAAEGAYQLDEGDNLWRLLATITVNKLRKRHRHHTAQKRSIDEEISVGGSSGAWQISPLVVAHDPTSDEAVALIDELQFVLERLEPVHREIVELRLNGHDLAEISEQTSRTERTVRRVLERFSGDLKARM